MRCMTNFSNLLNCEIGQYLYGRHYRSWGIWKCVYNDGARASGEFICDYLSKEDAIAFVYKMNGWTKKVA